MAHPLIIYNTIKKLIIGVFFKKFHEYRIIKNSIQYRFINGFKYFRKVLVRSQADLFKNTPAFALAFTAGRRIAMSGFAAEKFFKYIFKFDIARPAKALVKRK
jgi:hypothetical protein